jgi:hypothetical protein
MLTDTICTLRVTAPDADVARVSARHEQFDVGRPIEFDEMTRRISALEFVLGALAGEVVNGLREFADRRRVEIDHVEAVISGEVERALAYLEVVGEPAEPRIRRVHLKLFVSSRDEAGIRRLWPELLARLPIVCTMRAAVSLDLDLVVTA